MSKPKEITAHYFIMRHLMGNLIRNLRAGKWEVYACQPRNERERGLRGEHRGVAELARKLVMLLDTYTQVYVFLRHESGRERWVMISNDSFGLHESPAPWSDWSIVEGVKDSDDDFSKLVRNSGLR